MLFGDGWDNGVLEFDRSSPKTRNLMTFLFLFGEDFLRRAFRSQEGLHFYASCFVRRTTSQQLLLLVLGDHR